MDADKIPVGSAPLGWATLECLFQVTFSRATISATQRPSHEQAEDPTA